MNEITLLNEVTETESPENVAPVDVTETMEIVEVDRPFLTTSFENYTVTEGLLLLIALLLIVGFVWKELRRIFHG